MYCGMQLDPRLVEVWAAVGSWLEDAASGSRRLAAAVQPHVEAAAVATGAATARGATAVALSSAQVLSHLFGWAREGLQQYIASHEQPRGLPDHPREPAVRDAKDCKAKQITPEKPSAVVQDPRAAVPPGAVVYQQTWVVDSGRPVLGPPAPAAAGSYMPPYISNNAAPTGHLTPVAPPGFHAVPLSPYMPAGAGTILYHGVGGVPLLREGPAPVLAQSRSGGGLHRGGSFVVLPPTTASAAEEEVAARVPGQSVAAPCAVQVPAPVGVFHE